MIKKRYYAYLIYSWAVSITVFRIDKLEFYFIALGTILFIMLDMKFDILERLNKRK